MSLVVTFKKRLQSNAGFSMMSALIGMTVSFGVFVASMKGFTQLARHRVEAVSAPANYENVATKFEELLNTPYNDPELQDTTCTSCIPYEDVSKNIEWTVKDINPALKEITVRVKGSEISLKGYRYVDH